MHLKLRVILTICDTPKYQDAVLNPVGPVKRVANHFLIDWRYGPPSVMFKKRYKYPKARYQEAAEYKQPQPRLVNPVVYGVRRKT